MNITILTHHTLRMGRGTPKLLVQFAHHLDICYMTEFYMLKSDVTQVITMTYERICFQRTLGIYVHVL